MIIKCFILSFFGNKISKRGLRKDNAQLVFFEPIKSNEGEKIYYSGTIAKPLYLEGIFSVLDTDTQEG